MTNYLALIAELAVSVDRASRSGVADTLRHFDSEVRAAVEDHDMDRLRRALGGAEWMACAIMAPTEEPQREESPDDVPADSPDQEDAKAA